MHTEREREREREIERERERALSLCCGWELGVEGVGERMQYCKILECHIKSLNGKETPVFVVLCARFQGHNFRMAQHKHPITLVWIQMHEMSATCYQKVTNKRSNTTGKGYHFYKRCLNK